MKEIKNIYDNEEFFKSYSQLRKDENSYNELMEQPAMEKLLPSIEGKTVLDLGCGFGNNAMDFIKRGAKRVVAIDLSEKMLSVAREENSHPCIQYLNMDMGEISKINEHFDLVYSSLAFHYVENFEKLLKDIYSLLNEGGILLYSQEHPLTTATLDGQGHFNKDENGKYISYTLSNYNEGGKRVVNWFVDGLVKYHRPFAYLINTYTDTGFIILHLCEPKPSENAVEKVPKMIKELIKPSFLIAKLQKPILHIN